MTIPAEASKVTYNGNGATTLWTFNFEIKDEDDIDVILTDTDGEDAAPLTSNYSVDQAAGQVTYPTVGSPLPAGWTITLRRVMPLSQELDLTYHGAMNSANIETAFDRVVMIAQQHDESIGRAIKLKSSSALSDLTIEEPEAGTVPIWNAGATGLENGPSAATITAAQGYATAASTSATASATSATASATSATASATSATASATSATASAASATNSASSATASAASAASSAATVAVHIADATDAHAASAITNTPSGNLAATTVQAALNELQTDVDTRAPTASPTLTGTVTIPSPFTLGATSVTTTGSQLNYLNATTGNTGTGNIVLSASPTVTGTLTGAAGTFSGTVTAATLAATGDANVSGRVFMGKVGSGTGGQARFVQDDGTSRWAFGIPGTVGGTGLFLFNLVAGTEAFSVSSTNVLAVGGAATFASTVGVTGAISFASISSSNVVSNANLAQVATQTFKGRTTAATGNVEDLTATQATAILNALVGDSGSGGTKGLVPAPAAGDGAASKFLAASGLWATVPAAQSGSGDMYNLGLAASVAANAMTIALKQGDGTSDPAAGASAAKIGFRNSTATSGGFLQRSATAATSIVIPSSATLGTTSGQISYVYVYAIDNASVVELAVSGTRLWNEGSVQSTTQITAGATSATVLYSTTARAGVPVRYIGKVKSTQATAGTWASSPTEIALTGGVPCAVAASYSSTTTAFSTITTLLFPTKVYDTHSAYGTGTGLFTAPEAGFYQVNAKITVGSVNLGVGGYLRLTLNKNGSAFREIGQTDTSTTTAITYRVLGSSAVFCHAGETLSVSGTASAAVTPSGGADSCYLDISRLKD